MDPATRTVIDLFERISQIPRCSNQEKEVATWLYRWAEARSFSVQSDAAGNLVIRVPGSSGFEQAPVLILQGHMDMVCEKKEGARHDFAKDPIQLVQEGSWLCARETTLGADNGIALALALALADSPEVCHPPLELLFTVNEETGLKGAKQLEASMLSGTNLINLDSEDEGVFVVGCAGGRDATLRRPLDIGALDANWELVGLSARGMQGGHSGVDIGKHRANANQVLARLLTACLRIAPCRLVELKGGTGRNVIPRASEAVVACPAETVDAVLSALKAMADVVGTEFSTTDPSVAIALRKKRPAVATARAVSASDTARVCDLLMTLPNGPLEMETEFPLTVRTSANLAMVEIENGTLVVVSSQRSSVPSRLDAVCQSVEAAGRLAGATVRAGKGYPAWPMNRQSVLLEKALACYRQLYRTEAKIQIMHAGLECGVIGDLCPGMDMISLGPTIENPHSPSERLHLPSVEKVWHLLAALFRAYGKG